MEAALVTNPRFSVFPKARTMKILTNTTEIHCEIVRLIEECTSCHIAVAWASSGFKASDLLLKHKAKIGRMIVGTHFYQTDPQFIEDFLEHPNVRFIWKTDGVFHPKAYLFFKTSGEWECVIGSPNFTHGGFGDNAEMAILVDCRDTKSEAVMKGFETSMDEYWKRLSPISQAELVTYREAWRRKQSLVRALSGRYGSNDGSDGGKIPLKVPLLQMSWSDYLTTVRSEPRRQPQPSLEERLKVIRATRKLFLEHVNFKDIDLSGRRKIAGFVMDDEANFLWFGSMRGSGRFQSAVNRNDEHLSLALGLIPLTGPVTRETYVAYMEEFKKAFPTGGSGIGTATRLLAMKRPDGFVCLDSRNRVGLCAAFGIPQHVGVEDYWDSIIERILNEAAWWSAPSPASGIEREVWEARAAFLDSHFYDGKDMPTA